MLSGIPSAKNAPYEGRSVAAGAKDLGISGPEFVARLLVEEDLQVCFIRHGADEGEVAVLRLADPGSPTLIEDKDAKGSLYVLMPMRV